MLAAVIGIAAFSAGLLLAGRHRSETYTRYVSPPLADGTRFTFLYPSRLSVDGIMWHHNNSWIEHGDGTDAGSMFATRDRSWVHQFLRRFHFYGKMFPPNDEEIDVQFSALPKTPPTWAGTEDRHGTYYSNPSCYIHEAEVMQDRTGRDFTLEHSDSSRSPAFDVHDKLFVDSFQILPAGALVPK